MEISTVPHRLNTTLICYSTNSTIVNTPFVPLILPDLPIWSVPFILHYFHFWCVTHHFFTLYHSSLPMNYHIFCLWDMALRFLLFSLLFNIYSLLFQSNFPFDNAPILRKRTRKSKEKVIIQ